MRGLRRALGGLACPPPESEGKAPLGRKQFLIVTRSCTKPCFCSLSADVSADSIGAGGEADGMGPFLGAFLVGLRAAKKIPNIIIG